MAVEEMTVEQVLVRMLERFDGGRRWTRGCGWRDARGRFVSLYDVDEETRCCLLAMICRVREEMRVPPEVEGSLMARLRAAAGRWNLAHFNDLQPNFGAVRAVILAAIEGGK